VLAYAPRLEPFGLAPLEAAACGVPAVVLPEGGVRETVVDGVTGLYGSSVAELAAALDSVVGDTALRARLGTAALAAAVGRWDSAAAGRRLERHLLAATAGAPASAERTP
jgi:glycosyltransferase involved in cell wall biosynthesis